MPSGAALFATRAARRRLVREVPRRDWPAGEGARRPASDGWTRRKAEVELRARLIAVERDGYRKPERATFATLAEVWLVEYPQAKRLKRSTTKSYEQIVGRTSSTRSGRCRSAR